MLLSSVMALAPLETPPASVPQSCHCPSNRKACEAPSERQAVTATWPAPLMPMPCVTVYPLGIPRGVNAPLRYVNAVIPKALLVDQPARTPALLMSVAAALVPPASVP